MEQQRDVGIAAGEYQGRGRGEDESPIKLVPMDIGSDIDNDIHLEEDSDDDEALNRLPLSLIFYVESTGLVVYNDHIIDIAAKVVDLPESAVVSQPSYQSLVRTIAKVQQNRAKMYYQLYNP